jgi:hypothetical protein
MSKNFNIYYNNATGQVIMKKDTPKKDNDFDKKIEELSKFANLSDEDNKFNSENEDIAQNSYIQENATVSQRTFGKSYTNNQNYYKKDLIYGIKKTILSDFNFSNFSSNSNDFKIGINKNSSNNNNIIFDSFYLFPNIIEVNSKVETNIVNEKKVEMFENINEPKDIQYFPIDFIPSGIIIPLKKYNNNYSKIVINNIFWNIFQSIDKERYEENELLCITPDKAEFIYRKINLEINFEIHSQVSSNIIRKNHNKIIPYRNERIKTINPANSCLYKVKKLTINTLNGLSTNDIIIDFNEELNLDSALLCIRLSVANESYNILKGFDKYNKMFCGHIPFSQFIINFDYILI